MLSVDARSPIVNVCVVLKKGISLCGGMETLGSKSNTCRHPPSTNMTLELGCSHPNSTSARCDDIQNSDPFHRLAFLCVSGCSVKSVDLRICLYKDIYGLSTGLEVVCIGWCMFFLSQDTADGQCGLFFLRVHLPAR